MCFTKAAAIWWSATERQQEVAAIAETFEHAGVKCRITDNIEGELWKKLLLNCAGNAVTALGRAAYSVGGAK